MVYFVSNRYLTLLSVQVLFTFYKEITSVWLLLVCDTVCFKANRVTHSIVHEHLPI